MEGYKFDAAYIEKLRAGDTRTQEHFVGYLTEILDLKLRQRLHSPEEIGRVRQKSFERVLMGLRLHQPESLGAFVNTVCNNILFEHHRSKIAIERDST